ncbi:MAG: ribose-5-phosphate isomerase RpiA [Trueperaceae bacterium]|nr:ribose-5-phosphate isomerase RpiA [Trueperaceae bacterium]
MKQQADFESLKREAAAAALSLVEDEMVVGLGTGSTAKHFIDLLGQAVAAGELRGVTGVPTSRASESQALGLGIKLIELPAAGIDMTVDGMDEVAVTNGRLDAVKGLGGALLREKIVASAAATFVLIGDDSKLVSHLGEKSPLPVEVARFGWQRTLRLLEDLSAESSGADSHVKLRSTGSEPYVTDNGGLIVDCYMPAGYDAATLAAALDATPGVVGHGLFLGIAARAFLAGDGRVRELAAEREATL